MDRLPMRPEDAISTGEGLAWLEKALAFFADALEGTDPAKWLAVGRIAYALHNLPTALKTPDGWGRVWADHHLWTLRYGPPEVAALCVAFFLTRPEPWPDIAPGPERMDDLAQLFQECRSLWVTSPDDGSVAETLARLPEDYLEKRRVSLLPHTMAAHDGLKRPDFPAQ